MMISNELNIQYILLMFVIGRSKYTDKSPQF